MNIFLQGFFLQASLILALGAQNIFVLNSGLHRKRHLLVAFLSSICDMTLILIGVLGVATVFVQVPILKIIFGVVGVGFLGYYGLLKLKEAKANTVFSENSFSATTLKQTVLTTLAFSLLNPHVYLDTVVLIGGYSAKFQGVFSRFLFGLGASAFSFLWFFGLVLLASAGNKLVHNKKAMRTISALSGIILLWLSVRLGIDVFDWIKVESF
ncbi:MAG: LysE family transporter [Bacteriovoracaceae bacterium]|nr:LysE family transporter [Bacteriovoracaceae bacterium]